MTTTQGFFYGLTPPTIELQLELKDAKGKLLYTGRYTGSSHENTVWDPSAKIIGKLHSAAWEACLAEMINDPQWQQSLARDVGGAVSEALKK